MRRFILQLIALLLFACTNVLAQTSVNDSSNFKPYNRHILDPYTTTRHQLLFSLNYTKDYKPFSDPMQEGNIGTGLNAGLGLGYLYRMDLYGTKQSAGIGAKAEWFPRMFYKFNLILETDVVVIGSKELNGIVLSGGELNMSFNPAFTKKEAHAILYFLEVNIHNLEIKYGLDSWLEKITPVIFLDNQLQVLKITYHLDI